jgi:APA family basic amino acid/polyamine antiporter
MSSAATPINAKENARGLGLVQLIALATGQVIGAGVVTLVGGSIDLTGMSAWLAYPAAVLMCFCIIFPYILLAGMIRVKGGNYTFVATLLGDKWGGMYGMAFTMNVFACGMFALSLGNYLAAIFPAFNVRIVAIIAVTIFYIFNMMGVNFMSKIQTLLSCILISGLFLFIIIGMGHLRPEVFEFKNPEFFTNGAKGFLSGMALLIFSCYGHVFVVSFSKEATFPKRDVPLSMLITTGIILVIYTLITLVAAGVLPVAQVAGKPLTVVANIIMPTPLFYIFIIGGPIMALATTLNSSLSVFTRPFHQMTIDGWFPAKLGLTNSRGAPYLILTIMYLIAIIPIALNFSIAVITSNTVLIGRVADIVAICAILTLPKRLPDAWENRYLKISKPVFYGTVTFSLGVTIFSIGLSIGNMPVNNVYVTIALVFVFFIYATLRQKSGKVVMQKSYELQ